LGGVTFQHGLDEGQHGETDDVSLMERDQYLLRWSQYCSSQPAFDLDGDPFDIEGMAEL
jgi:hypothetical protein